MADSVKKLLVTDLSVLVEVGLLHDLADYPHGQLHSHFLYLLMELIPADLSTAVLVEVFENVVKVVLPEAVVVMQHRGNELVEAYLSVLVHVHALQDGVELLIGRLYSLPLEGLFDLIDR